MSIRVIVPGPLTTIQDAGRFGYQSSGIRPCGVMDRAAYDAAMALLGDCGAVLEATFLGPTLKFGEAAVLALTGADMQAKLDGVPVPRYQAIAVQPGQILSMGMALSGCRGYIAVRGGIDVPSVLGSRSTDLKCRLGGLEGRALKAGDLLPVRMIAAAELPAAVRSMSLPDYPEHAVVRVILGPQAEYFTAEGIAAFLQEEYEVSPDSDRMGMRLDGPAVASLDGTDIVSDGIVFGSVQITSSGKPILLMADHQTAGGYAKLATVLSFDLPRLAQLRPGNTVRFRRLSAEAAQELYTTKERSA